MIAFRSGPSGSTRLIDRRALLIRSAALVTVTVLAGVRGAAAAEAGDPTAPIRQLDAALLGAMKAGQATPFSQRFAMLDPAIEQAFDLDAVLRAAVGLSWDALPTEQKAALARTFRRYTVSSYAANFDSYDGQSFRVLPDRRALPNNNVVVRTELVRSSDSPVQIAYVMRLTGADWKAVDVLSDGTISQVAVQRSDFRGLLASGGAAALRAGLERKVASLSAGALA